MKLDEFRQTYPMYNDVSDADLARFLHEKFYSDMDYREFAREFFPRAHELYPAWVTEEGKEKYRLTGAIEPESMPLLENIGRTSLEALPEIGMFGGEAAGLALGRNPATGVLGGTLGEAGMFAAQQGIKRLLGMGEVFGLDEQPTMTQDALSVAERMPGTALALTLGYGAGPVAKKMLGPWAAKMTPAQRMVAETVEKEKLPLSPATYMPTKTAKALQAGSESFTTGRVTANYYRKKVMPKFNSIREEMLDFLPPKTDKISAGMELSTALKESKGILKGQAKKKYDEFLGALGGKDSVLEMSNTSKWIAENKDKIGADKQFRQLLEIHSQKGSSWKVDDAYSFQNQIWGNWKKNQQMKADLWESYKKDIGGSFKTLEEAKDTWKTAMEFNSNPTIRAISAKARMQPDQIIRVAFREGNLEDINLIRNSVSKETWDISRRRFLENLFDASSKGSDELAEGIGGTVEFNPGRFADLFGKYEKQIQNAFPEKYPDIRNFAQLCSAAAQDQGQLGIKSQLAHYLGGQPALTFIGLKMGGPAGVVVPNTFSFFLSHSLMSPKGYTRKWLTTGLGETKLGNLGIAAAPPLTKLGVYELIKPRGKDQEQIQQGR